MLKYNYAFIGIVIVYIFLNCFHAFFIQKTVYGDGIYYFSWLRSIVVDHDIDFRNEYSHFGVSQKTTKTNLTGNIYAIGPTILWLPFYIGIHSIIRGDGYSFIYQITVSIVSVFYAAIGLLLLYRYLIRHYPPTLTITTIFITGAATNLLFYGSIDTVNSHALSFFLFTLLINISRQRNLFILGIITGLLATIRIQDMAAALLLLPPLLFSIQNRPSVFTIIKSSFAGLLGILLGFSPQLIAWQLLYGTMLKSPYLDGVHGFNLLKPHILEVLFSPNNGLFIWTPILLIGIVGLWFAPISKTLKGIYYSLFVVQVLIISSWTIWWEGASFSGRMFITILPIFSIGIAAFLSYIPKYLRFFIAFGSISLNIFLIVFFLLNQ